MKQSFLILILSVCGLIACGETGNLHFKEGALQSLDTEISFSTLRAEVLNSKCISCHSNYKEYAVVSENAEKILASVEAGRMPKNSAPLSSAEISIIKNWINAGKPEGKKDQKPLGESEKIYAEILGPKCVQCHNPNGEAKFLDLSTRQAIWDQRAEILNFDEPEKSYLMEVVTDPVEPMPPTYSNLQRLTEEEVGKLTDWIRRGMP